MSDLIRDIVKQAIDLHVHVGPEIIPRKFTAQTLCNEETGKLAGCVLKNHFFPSVYSWVTANPRGLRLFGSVVLNNFVGGLNPHAIFAAATIAPAPLFVWMPTLHTKQFLQESELEIPLEWVGNAAFKPRKSKEVNPVLISKNGELCEEVMPVLRAIAEVNGVLCTGHISWQESVMVAKAARSIGLRKIVITHPIYQKIAMPITVQKELADAGCFIEHCYSMYSIDKIPINQIAAQIKAVGVERIVLSSDVGQMFSPSPSEALIAFASLLLGEGISESDLETMLCENPRKLL